MFATQHAPVPQAQQPSTPMPLSPPALPGAHLPCQSGPFMRGPPEGGQQQQPQATEQDPWSSWGCQSGPSMGGQRQQPQVSDQSWGAHNPQRPPWKINRKNTDALTPFNGVLEHYRDWAAWIRDHVSEDWASWREILDHSSQAPEELRPEQLKRLTIYGVNAWELSTDLWSFLLKQIGPTLYARRMTFWHEHRRQWPLAQEKT